MLQPKSLRKKKFSAPLKKAKEDQAAKEAHSISAGHLTGDLMEPPNKPTRPSTPKHQEKGILVKVTQLVNSEPMPDQQGGQEGGTREGNQPPNLIQGVVLV